MRGTRFNSGRMFRVTCLATLLALSPAGWVVAGQVRGTVSIDREGKPAVGARVWAAKLNFMETLQVREATVDGSGAFAIEVGPGRNRPRVRPPWR